MATSVDSAGSALAENEKYLDSIAGKVAEFQAATQEFSTELINSETVKFFVEAGTGLVEMATAMKQVGLFTPALLLGLNMILVSLQNIKLAKTFDDMIVKVETDKIKTDELAASIRALTREEQELLKVRLNLQIANHLDKNGKPINDEHKSQIRKIESALKELKKAQDENINTSHKLKGSFAGMFQSWDAFTTSVANYVRQNKFALIVQGITWAATAVTFFKQKIEESRQAAIDAAHDIQEAFEETNTTYENNIKTLSGLSSRFYELSLGVNVNGENESLSTEDYEEYLDIVEQICGVVESMPREWQLKFDTGNIENYKTLLTDVINLQNEILLNEKETRSNSFATEFKGIKTEYKDIEKDLTKFNGEVNDFYSSINSLVTTKSLDLEYGGLANLHEAISEYLGNASLDEHTGRLEYLSDKTDDGIEKLRDLVQNKDAFISSLLSDGVGLTSAELVYIEGAIAALESTFSELDAQAASAADAVMNRLEMSDSSSGAFSKLPQGMQTYFESYVASLYDTRDTADEYQSKSEDALNDIVDLITESDFSDGYHDLIDMSRQLETGDISVEDYEAAVSGFISGIQAAFGEGSTQAIVLENYLLSLSAGFDSVAAAASSSASTVAASTSVWSKFSDGFGDVQEKTEKLSEALKALDEGTLELDEVVELITEFPELAKYVDLTAENFGNLDDGIRAAMSNVPNELIDSLELMRASISDPAMLANLDSMISYLREMPVENVRGLAEEWGLVADAINDSNQARSELEQALADEDYDAGFNDRVEHFEGFTQLLDKGLFGSSDYKDYLKYYGLLGKTSDEVIAWAEANAKFLDFNDDGDDPAAGLNNFLEVIKELNETGRLDPEVASAILDGDNWIFNYDVNEIEKLAEALGWSTEMVTDFIQALRMYSEDWGSTPEDIFKEWSAPEIGLIDDTKNLAYLEDIIAYTGLAEEEVIDLIAKINELRDEDNQIEFAVELTNEDKITDVFNKYNEVNIPIDFVMSSDGETGWGVVTQQTVDAMYEYYGSVEKVVEELEILQGMENIEIQAGLTLAGGNLDTLLATEVATEEDNTVTVTVNMTTEGGQLVQEEVTVIAEDIKTKLEEAGIINLSTGDTEVTLEELQTTLDTLSNGAYIQVTDSTYTARNHLGTLSDYMNNLVTYKKITVDFETRYTTTTYGETPARNATGTSHARAGLSLLGDEYSPSGTPKPELVVSGDSAYLAGLDGPTLGYLNEGDTVYTYSDTKKILAGGGMSKRFPAFRGGTLSPSVSNATTSPGKTYWTYGSSISSSGSSSSSSTSSSSYSLFEDLYKYHQHLLAMDKMAMAEYLAWLEQASEDAYKSGEIELEDYRQYCEEVYDGLKELVSDWLGDKEHRISIIEGDRGAAKEVISIYKDMMTVIEKELQAAYAAGLTDNDDFVQEIQSQWKDCAESVADIEAETTENAKDAIEELIDLRIDMIERELEEEKDALDERRDALREFYDEQKEMLRDAYEEETYLEEQAEKRKAVDDIKSELSSLEKDDSAWAQKRKLELQEELEDAEKDLMDFERDKAIQMAEDTLDAQYEAQEAEIEAETALIEEKLNNQKALRDQALEDIRNGSTELYNEMIAYNDMYGSAISEDIVDMWDAAYEALYEYKTLYNEDFNGIRLDDVTGYEEKATQKPSGSSILIGDDSDATSGSQGSSESGVIGSSSYHPFGKVSDTSGNIGYGSEGTFVKAIQWALIQMGYTNGGGVVTSGYFLNNTTEAVKAFQRDNGVTPVDGIVGVKTRAAFAAHGYALGTSYAIPGLHEVDELGPEYLFTAENGKKYRMFSGGEKVLDAAATNFLYDFANSRGRVLESAAAEALSALQHINPLGASIGEIRMGDIIIQGNANEKTVSEIRRAQRESVDYMLREFNRLNR